MAHFNLRPIFVAVTGLGLTGQALLAGALELEEVLVTAQKRSESLSNTPLAVSVISGEAVRDLASFGFADLNNMTAGLTIAGAGLETDIAVRGLGTDLNGPVNPRVTAYLDGAFIQQDRGLFSGLYDMGQVELLRGPQGTLYGQASPAGALTLKSRDPNLEKIDGYIQQSISDQNAYNTQFGVSLPLIKNVLSLRISGLYDTNENSDVRNVTTGKALEFETKAYRIVALWQPTDRFRVRLAYHDIDDEFDTDKNVSGPGIDAEDRIALSTFKSVSTNDTDYTILEMTYEINDRLSATLVGTHQDNLVKRSLDEDGSPVAGVEQPAVDSDASNDQIEFRLASQGNDFWDWTIGGYYFDGPSDTDVDVLNYTAAPNAVFGPLAPFLPSPAIITTHTLSTASFESNDYGLFTHNTIHLSDKGTLTVGVRYIEAEIESTQPFNIVSTVPLFGQPFPVNTIITNGVSADAGKIKDDAVTGTLKYQYNVTDDLMAYVSFDRGFRRSSVNIAANPLPPGFGKFESEDSDNYEVGFKWKLWENRGLLNFAAYYQTYDDFQFQTSMQYRPATGTGTPLNSTPVVNIKEAEVYGFDSDLTVLLSQNWSLSTSLSYVNAELTDAGNVACTIPGAALPPGPFGFNTCDFSGERAGNSPEWSFNLSTEYFEPIAGSEWEWYLRALANAESEYFSIAERKELDDYATLDLFLGMRTESRWDARIWVKNVMDADAVLNTENIAPVPNYNSPNGGTVDLGLTWIKRQLNPRTVGATVSYTF